MSRKHAQNEPKNMREERRIIEVLQNVESLSRAELAAAIDFQDSEATLKRELQRLVQDGKISVLGKGRSTRYALSPAGRVLSTVDLDTYFRREIDERRIHASFNFDLVEHILPHVKLFSEAELEHLHALQSTFRANIALLPPAEQRREMTRLGIDLSWKSSQIEGNTYTLLETERLLLEKQAANGKTREEAMMLLNHKTALDFIIDNPDYLQKLSVARIEDIHRLLVQDLGIEHNIRQRRVGIIGTNYRPLDNEFQIREASEATCRLVNGTECIFSKALLVLVLLSYIQAFTDGNKRTARITANAVLIAHGYCPLSFRSVDSIDYKKAMLLFYEQNNLAAFKQIFMEQFEFAVKTYF